MNSFSRATVIIVCLSFVLAGMACAQQPSGTNPQALPKVTLAGSELRTMKSTSTGRDYDLYIHIPSDYGQNKTKKYPVLYILDGQWDFKLMDSVLGGLVYDKFGPEIILVAITYSGENANYNDLRAMDMTPTATPQSKGSGDAAKFLIFMKTELVPFIEKNYQADPSRRMLQGSSLAGLFTLYVMFNEPEYFSGYIAASPALTYGDGYAFKMEDEYAKAHKALPAKLFLAVGDREGLAAPVLAFMQNLRHRGYQGLKLETRVIAEEGHASNKPELFNRGLKFLFSNSSGN